jgi:hypothetical protein
MARVTSISEIHHLAHLGHLTVMAAHRSQGAFGQSLGGGLRIYHNGGGHMCLLLVCLANPPWQRSLGDPAPGDPDHFLVRRAWDHEMNGDLERPFRKSGNLEGLMVHSLILSKAPKMSIFQRRLSGGGRHAVIPFSIVERSADGSNIE